MAKRKSSFRMVYEGKLSQMDTQSSTSITMTSSKHIPTKRSSTISLRPKPLKQPTQMDSRSSSSLTAKSRSISRMERKKSYSQTVRSNVSLRMVKKKAYLQTAPFRGLRRMVLRLLNMQVVRRTFFSLMEHVSENIQTAASRKHIPMAR